MSCCGQKRNQLRQSRSFFVQTAPAPPTPAQRVPLVFTGSGAYLVTGPYSATVYQFFQGAQPQWVDARDAEVLLKTRFFQRLS
jgi:hypothetical protein